QAEASGITEEQFVQLALQRGMPATEIEKLRERINKLEGNEMDDTLPFERPVVPRVVNDSLVNNPQADAGVSKTKDSAYRKPELPIFGQTLFQHENQTFEPDLRI